MQTTWMHAISFLDTKLQISIFPLRNILFWFLFTPKKKNYAKNLFFHEKSKKLFRKERINFSLNAQIYKMLTSEKRSDGAIKGYIFWPATKKKSHNNNNHLKQEILLSLSTPPLVKKPFFTNMKQLRYSPWSHSPHSVDNLGDDKPEKNVFICVHIFLFPHHSSR